jgi:hypothetical protein
MDGSGGKAYPTEEQRRVVEKDVVRSSYRHGALRRTRVTGVGLGTTVRRSAPTAGWALMASDGLTND